MYYVTPYVGVWIETVITIPLTVAELSHPTWVCGLKLYISLNTCLLCTVTPYVGVWIETMSMEVFPGCTIVTPYVGVWIETWMCNIYKLYEKSHPTWVCGLKL